jgi:hypothetical protein
MGAARGIRRVVCAAVRLNDVIVLGPRHFDHTMHTMIARLATSGTPRTAWAHADQGFIDQYGVYMSRSEAYDVAVHSGQILPECRRTATVINPKLFSEDLY